MSDSVQPHRWQPTRLCCPWDSPGKNTGVGCHFLLQCVKVKSESEVALLCRVRLFAAPWTAAQQAPLSMGFSRQEYRSGCHRLLWDIPSSLHVLEKEMATPLQCSCLENPREGEAWWAAVYGTAQSWTRLK